MRKGFTLVEIMVVVVILGVLAGVGVPKLFGVIAKARASEVPVAAGTYVSLQNAYLHENNGIGSWKNIGYGAPGDGQTEYFEYSGCINGTIVFDQMEPDMPGWQATSRAGLNSCVTGSAWAVVIDPAGEREIDYRKIISSPECAMLTSTWGVVGETVEGMCETTGELHVAGTENKTPDKPETPAETSTEDPSDPEPSAPTSADNSGEQNEQSQGNCEDLKKAAKDNPGGGLVCVPECGMIVPKGQLKKYGFNGDYEKRKDMSEPCEKVQTANGSGNAAGSGGTNQGSEKPATNGEGSGTGENAENPPTSQGDGDNTTSNQGASGGGGGSGGATPIPLTDPPADGVPIEQPEEEEENPFLIVDQNNQPFDMSGLDEKITYCDSFNGNGSCKNKHSYTIDKSQCTKYDTQKKMCIGVSQQ